MPRSAASASPASALPRIERDRADRIPGRDIRLEVAGAVRHAPVTRSRASARMSGIAAPTAGRGYRRLCELLDQLVPRDRRACSSGTPPAWTPFCRSSMCVPPPSRPPPPCRRERGVRRRCADVGISREHPRNPPGQRSDLAGATGRGLPPQPGEHVVRESGGEPGGSVRSNPSSTDGSSPGTAGLAITIGSSPVHCQFIVSSMEMPLKRAVKLCRHANARGQRHHEPRPRLPSF